MSGGHHLFFPPGPSCAAFWGGGTDTAGHGESTPAGVHRPKTLKKLWKRERKKKSTAVFFLSSCIFITHIFFQYKTRKGQKKKKQKSIASGATTAFPCPLWVSIVPMNHKGYFCFVMDIKSSKLEEAKGQKERISKFPGRKLGFQPLFPDLTLDPCWWLHSLLYHTGS